MKPAGFFTLRTLQRSAQNIWDTFYNHVLFELCRQSISKAKIYVISKFIEASCTWILYNYFKSILDSFNKDTHRLDLTFESASILIKSLHCSRIEKWMI